MRTISITVEYDEPLDTLGAVAAALRDYVNDFPNASRGNRQLRIDADEAGVVLGFSVYEAETDDA